jgi:pimeloyl-ACP methyl ester carboxylesterase
MFAGSGRARLAYESAGVAGGAEVLLIHAGVNDRRSWHHVIERLGPRHRCVAFDMRGFGETTYEREDGWSPVDDAVAVLDAAAVERAGLVACSQGGRLALDLALAAPDRVSGLVLIGTAIRGAPDPGVEDEFADDLDARIEAADAARDLDEVNRLEAWMWLDGPYAEEGRVGGQPRELFLEMNGRALRAEDPGEQAELPPAWPRLGTIDVPALLLTGELDCKDIQALSARAAELIPRARIERIQGVAHVPHLEGDPATLDEITTFVGALRA